MQFSSLLLVGLVSAFSTGSDAIIDSERQEPSRSGSSPNTSIFTNQYNSSIVTLINNSDGYTTLQYSIWKAPYTDSSSLWLFQSYLSFTPGYVASQFGSSYSSGAYLGKGTIQVKLRPYSAFAGNAQGGTIYLSEYWPRSTDVTTTVTSSVSTTLSGSIEMQAGVGYSTGNGASISLTNTTTTQLSFTWTKSLSSVLSDPALSAQLIPTGTTEKIASWYYEVQNPNTAGKLTYHLDSFVMFEIGNNNYNCSQNCFHYEIEVHTWDYYQGWWGVWNFGTEYSGTTTGNHS